MATKKKSSKKSKTGVSKKPARNSTPPTKIIIEIVVRTEQGASAKILETPTADVVLNEAGLAPNFSYSFDLTNMRILNFIVGENRLDAPAPYGSFFARILDPNDPPRIRMTVIAISTNPGPSGTLTMKFLGKAVFDPAKNIPIQAASGGFDEFITLPA